MYIFYHLKYEIYCCRLHVPFISFSGNHSVNSNIAFFAVLRGSAYSINAGQTIIFDDAITNNGQAYESHIGVFTAPKDGVYQFTATLLTSGNTEIWCNIMQNGNAVARINERSAGTRHGSGSQAVILNLKEGILRVKS